ncbi:tol-pal system protein YbgF [Myxococcota bacterium]|nr:tol-pal system protein YbgF [Myxococcota bacterium]
MSRWLGLVPVLGLTTACAASTTGLEEELSRMRRDLAAMKQELQDTQLSVQRLEGRVTLLSLGREQVGEPPTTEIAASTIAPRDEVPMIELGPEKKGKSAKRSAEKKVAAREAPPQKARERVLPVVRLTGKAEAEVADDGALDTGALDDGSPPIVIKMGPDDGDKLTVDRDVLKKPDPVLGAKRDGGDAERPAKIAAREATSAELEAEYGAALSKLRVDGKPAEARAMFEAFVRAHPRSNLADNAAYWIGETHFAEKSHDRALAAFLALQSEHPRSPKIPDALLRMNESYAALGDVAKAEAILKQIIDAYPKSEAAQTARARLASSTTGGGR